MNPVKVLLSDFQFLTREGLIRLIEQDSEMELVGVNEGPEGLLENVLENHPDVVLLDYEKQDPILLTLLRKILQSRATHVLIITNDHDQFSIGIFPLCNEIS